jgi:hypothetical protein
VVRGASAAARRARLCLANDRFWRDPQRRLITSHPDMTHAATTLEAHEEFCARARARPQPVCFLLELDRVFAIADAA